jgi:membrane associated rhomboid family serine protease
VIPVRANVPARTFPVVNLSLAAVNVWAFVHELVLGRRLEPFLNRWGLVPARYAHPGVLDKLGAKLYFGPFLTSMFLHGGWLHIIANMWVLLIFGGSVEDRLGHARYLLFYLLAGFAAGLTQVWFSLGSPVPTIGASGAIAGVMGAFFLLYPLARVTIMVPLFIFFPTFDTPAFLFLGLWLWTQVSSGLSMTDAGAAAGVAWWAHVGGFVGGGLLLAALLPRAPVRRARRQQRGQVL